MNPSTDRIAVIQKVRSFALAAAVAGLALSGVGFVMDRQAFAPSYLTAYLFWIGVTLGCLPLIMLHHLTDGGWGYPIRRLMEIILKSLPLMALLFLPVAVNLKELYLWARPEAVAHDALLQQKQLYLNPSFFYGRAVFFFVIWGLWAYGLIRGANAYEKDHSPKVHDKLQVLSGAGLVMYGLTVTFSCVDWSMSLEPHWYSTIYGFLFMMGQTLAGFSIVIILTGFLSKNKGPLSPAVTPSRTHDLGKLLLAFIMLWAYVCLSQFIIIWSGNLAEETPWYLRRLSHGWNGIAIALTAFHFFVPLGLLLSRDLKRNLATLAPVAALIAVMRYVDLFWLVKPVFNESLSFHWLDLTCLAGIGGLWLFFVLSRAVSEPLIMTHDPLEGAEKEAHAH
ncbi:MAG TPA: hypothetical protein VL688_06620 [Verrucomicrobiae bacterium]|jgi:hypothetical protein|nr:hypothetical protein [Verrucomicrobiae bacterium]